MLIDMRLPRNYNSTKWSLVRRPSAEFIAIGDVYDSTVDAWADLKKKAEGFAPRRARSYDAVLADKVKFSVGGNQSFVCRFEVKYYTTKREGEFLLGNYQEKE